MKTFTRFLTLLTLVLLVSLTFASAPALAFLPVTGSQVAAPNAETVKVPTLDKFSQQVVNGVATQVTGIHVDGRFAFPVVQQPKNQPAFVSSTADTITEFRSARSFGSLGFLAHNTLAGENFSDVAVGDLVAVVYGDGHYVLYEVKQVRRLQAVEPTNPYSSFTDLASKKTLTAEDLFYQTYGVKDTLILQTCIAAAGNDSWGRLFIIAEPYIPAGKLSN